MLCVNTIGVKSHLFIYFYIYSRKNLIFKSTPQKAFTISFLFFLSLRFVKRLRTEYPRLGQFFCITNLKINRHSKLFTIYCKNRYSGLKKLIHYKNYMETFLEVSDRKIFPQCVCFLSFLMIKNSFRKHG